jgi:hypothetical protein
MSLQVQISETARVFDHNLRLQPKVKHNPVVTSRISIRDLADIDLQPESQGDINGPIQTAVVSATELFTQISSDLITPRRWLVAKYFSHD